MTALETLKKLHRIDSKAQRISLAQHGLVNFNQELLFIIQNFDEVRHLDLSCNMITTLPSTLGVQLPFLVSIDLTNNPLQSMESVGKILSHCHNLTSLSLTLVELDEAKTLLKSLPQLCVLNDVPLRPLSKRLDSIDYIPINVELGKSVEVVGKTTSDTHQRKSTLTKGSRDLNSCKNNTKNCKLSPPSNNSSLENIKLETLDYVSIDQKLGIDENVEYSRSIFNGQNNHVSTICDQSNNVLQKLDITNAPAKRVSIEFTTFINKLMKAIECLQNCQHENVANKDLISSLNKHIEIFLTSLTKDQHGYIVDGSTNASILETSSHLYENKWKIRWNLIEICGQYAVEKIMNMSKPLGEALLKLLELQNDMWIEIMQMEQRKNTTGQSSNTKESTAILNDKEVRVNKMHSIKYEVQVEALLNAAETLEHELQVVSEKLMKESKERQKLQLENERLLNEHSINARDLYEVGSSTSVKKIDKANTTSPNSSDLTESATESGEKPGSKLSVQPYKIAGVTPCNNRKLSLIQLLELIKLILSSKNKHNGRTKTLTNAPSETMEQHMYSYLTQRFGLPSLVQEYASSIWRACCDPSYLEKEHDVVLFYALLRNEVDEGFLTVKQKLQEAIRELLRVYFRSKYPIKSELAIKTMVDKKLCSNVYEHEWTQVITYLYNPNDSHEILKILKSKAKPVSLAFQASHERKPSSLDIFTNDKANRLSSTLSLSFTTFEGSVLNYQLQGRLRMLKKFKATFCEFDTTRSGVIKWDDAKLLVKQVAPSQSISDIEAQLLELDPHQRDIITFSDIVGYFLAKDLLASG